MFFISRSHQYFKRIMSSKFSLSKPLNIMVLTENNCPKTFENVEQNIFKCVSSSDYLVYQLFDSEIFAQPWMQSTFLLVIISRIISDSEAALLEKYVENSGKILLICSKFKTFARFKCFDSCNANLETKIKILDGCDVPINRGNCTYISDSSDIIFTDSYNKPLIQKTSMLGGTLIASEVYLDRDIDCTNANLFLSYNKNRLSILTKILTEHLSLKPASEHIGNNLSDGYYASNCQESKSVFPCQLTVNYHEEDVVINIFDLKKSVHSIPFNLDLYFSSLDTESYGQKLIYFRATTSTMDIADKMSHLENCIFFTSMQLSGKGRGSNKWISPSGCAAFTLVFELGLSSNLGQRLSMVQHIAAIAVVHGIRSCEKYKDLQLKIKWPNDIYFDQYKIGGLLVTSTLEGNKARVKIGWGINVSNSSPTVCLHDIIKMYNENINAKVPLIQVEELVAFTVSKMEYFTKNFQNSGPDETFSCYYSYWMHQNQEVTIQQLGEKGIITGLDEYGFLSVKTSTGKEISLQPDGNRFDVSKNLISAK